MDNYNDRSQLGLILYYQKIKPKMRSFSMYQRRKGKIYTIGRYDIKKDIQCLKYQASYPYLLEKVPLDLFCRKINALVKNKIVAFWNQKREMEPPGWFLYETGGESDTNG